jgi:hypothetical protein
MNKKGEITMVELKLSRKKLPTRQENKLLLAKVLNPVDPRAISWDAAASWFLESQTNR